MGTSKRVELTMGCYLLVLLVAGLASAHEYFPEKCPEFQPMQGFDWDQFSNGVWYVTQKFATRSTTALQRKGWAGPRVQVHRQAVRCQRGSACQDERPLPSQPDWRGQLRGVGHRLLKLRAHLHLSRDRSLHHHGPPEVLLYLAEGCRGGRSDHRQVDRAAGLPSPRQQPRPTRSSR